MSLFVKICGMTDARSVAAAVDAGADAVGFVFYQRSPRNLSLAEAGRLAAEVPPGVLRVAVTLHPPDALCRAILEEFRPDVLQTDAADLPAIELPPGVEAWPVLREPTVPDAGQAAGTYVYEGALSGHGQTVDWARAADVARRGNMLLAGGLSAANVAEAIRTVRPWGVDVSSAVESAPGQKSAAKIRTFIDAARAA